MIFITVGTNEAPFDRLLEAVDALHCSEELIVQHGASAVRPDGAECHEFMAFDAVVEHVRAARLVISHAGVGSVIVALANGKRPVVVPRLRRFGEAVDDHQLAFARRLHTRGLVCCIERPDGLARALALSEDGAFTLESGSELADDLQRYLLTRTQGGMSA